MSTLLVCKPGLWDRHAAVRADSLVLWLREQAKTVASDYTPRELLEELARLVETCTK